MRQLQHSTTERKCKHLSAAEREKIEYMSEHNSNTEQTARELGRSYNCVKHELEGGMTDPIKQKKQTKIMAHGPRFCAVFRKAAKSSIPLKQNSPRRGSCRFHGI